MGQAPRLERSWHGRARRAPDLAGIHARGAERQARSGIPKCRASGKSRADEKCNGGYARQRSHRSRRGPNYAGRDSGKYSNCSRKHAAGRSSRQSHPAAAKTSRSAQSPELADLSQLRTFFGFFALISFIKACVFIGTLPKNGRVETKCLPFGSGLLAVCR